PAQGGAERLGTSPRAGPQARPADRGREARDPPADCPGRTGARPEGGEAAAPPPQTPGGGTAVDGTAEAPVPAHRPRPAPLLPRERRPIARFLRRDGPQGRRRADRGHLPA